MSDGLRTPQHGREHRPDGPDPIKAGPWHNVGAAGEPAFVGTWANSGGTAVPMRFRLIVGRAGAWASAPTGVYTLDKMKGSLEIQGSVTGGSPGDTIFVLPDGYHPDHDIRFLGVDDTNRICIFMIQASDGAVIFVNYGVA